MGSDVVGEFVHQLKFLINPVLNHYKDCTQVSVIELTNDGFSKLLARLLKPWGGCESK
jgi:hypothetical protein